MEVTSSTSDGISHAISCLRAGGLVALPTETVYGLGADARNEEALQRLYLVKGRPSDHPMIVHLASVAQVAAPGGESGWARSVPDDAYVLAAAFWPGPLTLLLWRDRSVSDTVTGGRDTIGLRVPAHPVVLSVLRGFGGGVAAPSANRFGAVSPTTAAHVLDDIGDRLDPVSDLVLDGGPCAVGIESTILDLTVAQPTILRPGAIPAEAIEDTIRRQVIRRATGPSRAPGMMAAHYAPRAELVLADSAQAAEARVSAFLAAGKHAEVLSLGSDADTFARSLYSALRAADDRGLDAVVLVPPPEQGIGAAIVDRLQRAATGSRRTRPHAR